VETEASITSAGISSMADVDCMRIAHFKAQITPENAPASRLYPSAKSAFVFENGNLNPKTEIEPRISRMDTDYERVMETIFKPVWCILKSVKIRAIRGQNSNEAPCNLEIRFKPRRAWSSQS
jgi:hypothetical protein